MRLGKEQSAGFARDDDNLIVPTAGHPAAEQDDRPTPGRPAQMAQMGELLAPSDSGLADLVLEGR